MMKNKAGQVLAAKEYATNGKKNRRADNELVKKNG
jgi:hypothetical protein